MFSKTYNSHINVQCCISVKSIKYISKESNKSNDLAVFEVQDVNKNDKVTQYQRDLSVQHFAVYFEILFFYFTEQNVIRRALEPSKTTLTEFFTLCQKLDVCKKYDINHLKDGSHVKKFKIFRRIYTGYPKQGE